MKLTDEFKEIKTFKGINRIGEKFNSLTIIGSVYKKNRKIYWLCKCDCGNTTLVRYDQLTNNQVKSCGCDKESHHVHIGDKFGRLTAIKQVENNNLGQFCWLCKCSCGNEVVVTANHLRTGHTTSCGCYSKEITIKNSTKHGMTNTKFYKKFISIKRRCTNKNCYNYYLYGGRGIKCEWNTFNDFKNDMYESYLKHVAKYGEKETTIDRINVNGNYCKENCRWATIKEQQNNKRTNVFLTNSIGERHTLKEWSEIVNISNTTISDRLKHGYSVDEALYTPLYVRRSING